MAPANTQARCEQAEFALSLSLRALEPPGVGYHSTSVDHLRRNGEAPNERASPGKPRPHRSKISNRSIYIRPTKPGRWQAFWPLPPPSASSRPDLRNVDSVP